MVSLSRQQLGHQWHSPHTGQHLLTEGFLNSSGIYWTVRTVATLLLVLRKFKFSMQTRQLSDFIIILQSLALVIMQVYQSSNMSNIIKSKKITVRKLVITNNLILWTCTSACLAGNLDQLWTFEIIQWPRNHKLLSGHNPAHHNQIIPSNYSTYHDLLSDCGGRWKFEQ